MTIVLSELATALKLLSLQPTFFRPVLVVMASPVVDTSKFPSSLVASVQRAIDGTSQGEFVTAWEHIQQLLVQGKVACVGLQLPPDRVGVHPANRARLGVGGSEAHILGEKILTAGWSWRKSADAVCVESPPSPWGDEAEEFNASLSRLSEGMIPPLASCKYLSLGASHTNVFLRAARANCPTPVASMRQTSGCMDFEKLALQRPAFSEACNLGIKWTVLDWQCPYVWPTLADLIQKALNTEAAGGQSEIEVMLMIHKLATSTPCASDGGPDWAACGRQACRSLPACSGYIDKLVDYVMANSGGDECPLLHNLASFQNAFASRGGTKRTLGGEFIGAVANAATEFGPRVYCPYLMMGCLETNLMGDVDADGMSRMINPSSVKKLTAKANRERVLNAETILRDCRSLCDQLAVTGELTTKHCGRAEVRMVCHLLKQDGVLEDRKFKSPDEIGQVLFICLCFPSAHETNHLFIGMAGGLVVVDLPNKYPHFLEAGIACFILHFLTWDFGKHVCSLVRCSCQSCRSP